MTNYSRSATAKPNAKKRRENYDTFADTMEDINGY